MAKNKKSKSSKWAWGVFWLLIAALILSNYFGGFVYLGVWSVLVAALACAVLVYCIASLALASIPIPLAALYYIFQVPLGLPFLSFWMLVLVTLLITCGFHVLLPRRFRTDSNFNFNWNDGSKNRHRIRSGEARDDETDGLVEEGDDENNPYIRVKFGHVCRYLHSECLETAELYCSCGAMEVFFDQVELHPDGAEINVNCNLGSIEIYVPGHWNVVSKLSAS